MNDRIIIEQLSRSYINSKRILKDNDMKIARRDEREIAMNRYLVERITNTLNYLSENDRFIIENEVCKGKKGEWYRGYLSAPTYYRHRKDAYANFIKELR